MNSNALNAEKNYFHKSIFGPFQLQSKHVLRCLTCNYAEKHSDTRRKRRFIIPVGVGVPIGMLILAGCLYLSWKCTDKSTGTVLNYEVILIQEYSRKFQTAITKYAMLSANLKLRDTD